MDAPQVELAKRAWETLNRRDFDAFLSLIDPAVEFDSFATALEGSHYRGHDGVREWWDAVPASLGGLRYEPLAYEALVDGGVLTQVVIRGTADGVDVEQTMWHVGQFGGEKAVWWATFATEAEARSAFEARQRK